MVQPVILIRIGYGYVVVRIGGETICILIFGLALYFPIYAAHLQDDKCGLAFTRFMDLCPSGGKKGRNCANMTLEEAEEAAAREGLVLVPSRKNPTGYKGVTEKAARGSYEAAHWEEGALKFIGSYASKHMAALEYARWIGPQNAKREAAAVEAQAAAANILTLEEAEDAAAREGLVLVPSKKGYKGVRQFRGTFRAISNEKVIGNYATPYQAALEYARHIGPQQAAAEKATAMARRPTLLETAAGSITGVLAIARTRKPKN